MLRVETSGGLAERRSGGGGGEMMGRQNRDRRLAPRGGALGDFVTDVWAMASTCQ